jgi:hypothetical protein
MEDDLGTIIAGARVGDAWRNVYVVGSLDDRITLYAQQVRAMNLAGALVAGREDLGDRILVVGAGAAGLSLAASLALLLPQTQVVVYELDSRVVHLQANCTVRNLHPHIYDWPSEGSKIRATSLPILNWEAGPANEVARQISDSFYAISACINGHSGTRLRLKFNVRVGNISQNSGELLVATDHPEGARSERFTSVFLAAGFGEERATMASNRAIKYWFDGSLPSPFPMGQSSSTVIISGNGDGGLIDLAAAAIDRFDHTDLIRIITSGSTPHLCNKLLELEAEISRESRRDILQLYNDNGVLEEATSCNLLDILNSMRKPRRDVIFHTKGGAVFTNRSSILNRLVAYLFLNAGSDGQSNVRHLFGPMEVESIEENRYRIAGAPIVAGSVVVRHGPDRAGVLAPFGPSGEAYAIGHKRWLSENLRQNRPPELVATTMELLSAAALRAKLPVVHPTESPGFLKTPRQPQRATSLRICVTAASQPLGRPLNLLMPLAVRRLPAIAVIVGIDPGALDAALQAARAMAEDVNARLSPGLGATPVLELPIRTWTVAERPVWPTADGARGLIWSPVGAQPDPSDLTDALRGARWAGGAAAGDVLVIALRSGGVAAALALSQAIRNQGPAQDDLRNPREVPVYAWSHLRLDGSAREADLNQFEAKMPALARLRRRLAQSQAPADQSDIVECAREMRLFPGEGPSPAWLKASQRAIELHDISLLLQPDNGAERPPLSECAIAAGLVSLVAKNEAILSTLAFLPVASPVLESLLHPANSLARLALGLVSEEELRSERTVGNLGRISGAVPSPATLFWRSAVAAGEEP